MKNDKMLERCLDLALYLDGEQRGWYDFVMDHPESDVSGLSVGGILARMVLDLKEDIAVEECKSSGKLGALNAAKRIIKSAKSGKRPALHLLSVRLTARNSLFLIALVSAGMGIL